jgi:tetratricopeptide (TPR) repeat protein
MRVTKSIICVLLLIATGARAAETPESRARILKAMSDYEDDKDDLSLRIAIKRLARVNMPYSEWLNIRRLLHRRPGVGYSMLFKWDRLPFKDSRNPQWVKTETRVNEWLASADKKMLSRDFQAAFTMYQRAANTLKKEITGHHLDNYLLYQTIFHSMARALYGAGRFDDSLAVYGWITKNYPRYRQVLFEKMWAAFRAHHADLALGAIASQRSAYFSDYMEPESYLVQIYLYKKLCRNEETKAIRQDVLRFRERLAHGKYTYADWARSDLENYSLYRLTTQKVESSGGPITRQEKIREQDTIRKLLMARFEEEKTRLMHDLNQVLAYSYISVGADKLKLQSGELDRRRLRRTGQEYWPVDDSEDWLDELGDHLYIGASQCQPKS